MTAGGDDQPEARLWREIVLVRMLHPVLATAVGSSPCPSIARMRMEKSLPDQFKHQRLS